MSKFKYLTPTKKTKSFLDGCLKRAAEIWPCGQYDDLTITFGNVARYGRYSGRYHWNAKLIEMPLNPGLMQFTISTKGIEVADAEKAYNTVLHEIAHHVQACDNPPWDALPLTGQKDSHYTTSWCWLCSQAWEAEQGIRIAPGDMVAVLASPRAWESKGPRKLDAAKILKKTLRTFGPRDDISELAATLPGMVQELRKPRLCENCGITMDGRFTQRFCCAGCRVQWHRANKKPL